MRKLDLGEVKRVDFNILREFQKCCEAHGLKFYLCGGTMLGAARHKGFIPWDDDVDVCMPRPEYSRLIRLYRKNRDILPGYLKLVCCEMGTMEYPFMKIIDTRTKCNMEFIEEGNMDGLWIDVLPVDGLPSDEREVKMIYRKADLIRHLITLNNARLGEGKTPFRKVLKYVTVPAAKLIGMKRSNELMIRLVKQHPYSKSEYVGIVTWGLYGPPERMKKSEFEKSVSVQFEGHTFPAMSCWESYLTNLYGDYMQLPPVEKRKTHDMEVWAEEDIFDVRSEDDHLQEARQ